MNTKNKETRRFEVLDSFRGLAAIVVAIFHYTSQKGLIGTNVFIANGHRFVDFFFVLSGFIIYLNYDNIVTFSEQKTFMYKRIWRLYPLHIFVLILFFLFELLKAILFTYGYFNKPAFSTNSLQSLIPNLLLLQGIVDSPEDFTWNYPSWSISVEMINYLIFVTVIPLIGKIDKSIRPYILLLISFLSLALLSLEIKPFELVVKCSYGFFLGCFVLHLYKTRFALLLVTNQTANIVEVVFIIVICLTVCYLPESLSSSLSIIYGLVILVFAFEKGFLSKLLKNKIFLLFGSLSYSIYMTHALIANVLKVIFINILKFDNRNFDFTIIPFIIIVISISYLTYHYIELRALKFRKKLSMHHSEKKGLESFP